MHPEKYEAGERPRAGAPARPPEALPPGARAVAARGDLGEFDTEQFLRDGERPPRARQPAAAGLGRERVRAVRLPGGGHVLVMRLGVGHAPRRAEFAGRCAAQARRPGAGAVTQR